MREVGDAMSAAVFGGLLNEIRHMRPAIFTKANSLSRHLCAEIFFRASIHFRGLGLLGGQCRAKLPQRARVQFLAVVTGVGARNIR